MKRSAGLRAVASALFVVSARTVHEFAEATGGDADKICDWLNDYFPIEPEPCPGPVQEPKTEIETYD